MRLRNLSRLLIAAAATLGPLALLADEKKEDGGAPRITAIAPLEISPGATVSLRIRGAKLNDAKELKFSDAPMPIPAEIKEKKSAEVPNGADAKKVGDTQVHVELKIPAELPLGTLSFSIVTPGGATETRTLRVVEAGTRVEEKEPDNGFREAQSVEYGKTVRGVIKEEKDVDVFRVEGHAGKRLSCELFAVRGGSLLDGMLTLFDERGHLLNTAQAAGNSPDPRLDVLLPASGSYYVCVADANDRGGAWHSYVLEIKEVQP